MKCDLLLLDYDGTLCNTKPSIVYSITQTFLYFNRIVPSEEYVEEIIAKGYPISEAFQVLSNKLGEAYDRSLWITKYREVYETEGDNLALLYEFVPETIQRIIDRGIPIIILSNKGIDAVTKSLNKFGLTPYIDMVITDRSSIVPIELKPSRMSFDEIIQPTFPHINIKNILMLGDTKADIEFAHNCGIKSCWASYGYGNQTEIEKLQPDLTIDSFSELEKIISV